MNDLQVNTVSTGANYGSATVSGIPNTQQYENTGTTNYTVTTKITLASALSGIVLSNFSGDYMPTAAEMKRAIKS
jgi:hypothetical protein